LRKIGAAEKRRFGQEDGESLTIARLTAGSKHTVDWYSLLQLPFGDRSSCRLVTVPGRMSRLRSVREMGKNQTIRQIVSPDVAHHRLRHTTFPIGKTPVHSDRGFLLRCRCLFQEGTSGCTPHCSSRSPWLGSWLATARPADWRERRPQPG